VSTTAYRNVAEALANAQRYAAPGPVAVRLETRPGLVTVEARNPTSGLPPSSGRSGHGLTGVAERVALFGGTLQARPEGSEWVLRAEIPTGAARG
jgi:signal transduction histidine kinase